MRAKDRRASASALTSYKAAPNPIQERNNYLRESKANTAAVSPNGDFRPVTGNQQSQYQQDQFHEKIGNQETSPYMELKKQGDLLGDGNSQATRSQTKKNYEDVKSVKSISRYSKVSSQMKSRKSVKVP